MEKISRVSGVAAPLKMSNVDTDQILPAQFLKRITKTGFEDALFFHWRKDPEFLLNNPPYDRAKILVAGPDFGTGSSREHAVWALKDFGFRAVISARFGDIFRGNAGKQGLVTAEISEAETEELWGALEANPGLEMTVDLEARALTVGNMSLSFNIDDYTRWRLMEGLDDISLTLRSENEIAEFESRRPAWMPTTTS
jgi:3-isopropylmalate/(R)-2-methylmalate dehydratase small subunit